MQSLAHFYSEHAGSISPHQTRLLEEIAFLEARLHHIGQTGDCAYEKSLARSYDTLLRERRRQLQESGLNTPTLA